MVSYKPLTDDNYDKFFKNLDKAELMTADAMTAVDAEIDESIKLTPKVA